MKVIGITGGVGAGKSSLLKHLIDKYKAHVIFADEVAHRVTEPGNEAYKELIDLFGEELIIADGHIDKQFMAKKMFDNPLLRKQVNEIIHPAVKRAILSEINIVREKQETSFIFIEAALLIEDHYDLICDELWYIHADENVRRKRLKESRNYSEEKIQKILDSQLKEEEFRKKCKIIIDNSEDIKDAFKQIEDELGGMNPCTR